MPLTLFFGYNINSFFLHFSVTVLALPTREPHRYARRLDPGPERQTPHADVCGRDAVEGGIWPGLAVPCTVNVQNNNNCC